MNKDIVTFFAVVFSLMALVTTVICSAPDVRNADNIWHFAHVTQLFASFFWGILITWKDK